MTSATSAAPTQTGATDLFSGIEQPSFDVPISRSRGASNLEGTPVRGWVKEANAHRDQSVKIGPVTEDQATKLIGMIRRAGAEIKVGIAVSTVEPVKGQRGKVSFRFQAKDPKATDMSPEAVAARVANRAKVKAVREANPKAANEDDKAYAARIRGIVAAQA